MRKMFPSALLFLLVFAALFLIVFALESAPAQTRPRIQHSAVTGAQVENASKTGIKVRCQYKD